MIQVPQGRRQHLGGAASVGHPPPAVIWLVQGHSQRQSYEVGGDAPAGTRTRIGRAEECDWRVGAAGVERVHLEVYWDGSTLWIGSAGEATIDGRSLSEFVAIRRGCEIRFGGATLAVELPGARGGGVAAHSDRTQVASRVHPTAATPPLVFPESSATSEPTVIVGDGQIAAYIASARGAAAATKEPVAHPARFVEAPETTGTSAKRNSQTLPTRTWALLGATCIALMGALIIEDEAPTPATPARTATENAMENRKAAQTTPAQPIDPPAARGEVVVVEGAMDATLSVSSQHAAQLLVEGRHEEAMAVYVELSGRHPEVPAYAAAARILRNRIETEVE